MRYINLLFLSGLMLFLLSCGEKKEEEVVQAESPKEEIVQVDTTIVEPTVEKVVYEEPAPKFPRIINVKEGQWLYGIARDEYGSMYAWSKIYEANKDKISDPNIIYPGQELLLPE